MFGWFKKKKSPINNLFDTLDMESINAMSSAAKVLSLPLVLSENQKNYNTNLRSKFVRGYIFGFFDAATQKLGLPHKSEIDAMARIIAGHSFLLDHRGIDSIQYVRDSINLQDDPTYKAAHQKGVDELYECFSMENSRPYSLMKYFIDQE